MKTIKFFVVAMAMSLATNVSAQFVNSSGGKSSGGFASESAYADQKGLTNEINFYIQNGWGLGYQLRKEFNPYVGWNVFGFSYMSGFKKNSGPADAGQMNFKLLGARGYTPAWKAIRGYVDLNLGYTLSYNRGIDLSGIEDLEDILGDFGYDYGDLEDILGMLGRSSAPTTRARYSDDYLDYLDNPGSGINVYHHFCLDFGVGVQVHKNVAIGYNLNFLAGGYKTKSHWAKISFLF